VREDSPDNDIDERELVNESDEDLQAYQSGSELMDDEDFEAMLVAIEERKSARQKRREIAAPRRLEALEAEYAALANIETCRAVFERETNAQMVHYERAEMTRRAKLVEMPRLQIGLIALDTAVSKKKSAVSELIGECEERE